MQLHTDGNKNGIENETCVICFGGGGGWRGGGLIKPYLFFHIFWLYSLLTLVFTCSSCAGPWQAR